MKKESLVITTLVVVIIAAAATIGYILTKPPQAETTVAYPDNTGGLTEQEKIQTLISLNQSSTAKHLSNEERIKILQSLHK